MNELLEDLRTIGAMQQHLLPTTVPHPLGWQIAVHSKIGSAPGGNYHDFLPLRDGRWLFVLADASDEGGPAAALAAMLRVFLHSCPLTSGHARAEFCPIQGEIIQAPHMLLGQVNQVIVENSLEGQTVSAFCGVLNPLEGTLHFANAGHPSPRWYHARNRSVEALRFAVGLPLGMDAHATYHHKRIEIEPGDVLLFYTDGKHFGLDRLDRALRNAAFHGADAVIESVLGQWHKGSGQDDTTVIVMHREA